MSVSSFAPSVTYIKNINYSIKTNIWRPRPIRMFKTSTTIMFYLSCCSINHIVKFRIFTIINNNCFFS